MRNATLHFAVALVTAVGAGLLLFLLQGLACASSGQSGELPQAGENVAASGQEALASGRSQLDYVEKLIREGMLDVADAELSRFMETEMRPPLRQRGALLQGDVRFLQSNYAEAGSRYARAFDIDPHGEHACEALYKAGQCEFLLHQYEQAIFRFQKVGKLFPDCAQACPSMTAAGRSFMELGDYEQATRQFEEALAACEAEQKNGELLYWLGMAQERTNLEKARESFENLLRTYPGTEAAFRGSLEISQILFDDGNSQGALDVIGQALSFQVDKKLKATGFMRRGELFDRLGQLLDSGREYAECFNLSADSSICETCNLNSQKAYLSAKDCRQADLVAQKLLSGNFSAEARRFSFLTRARASRAAGRYQDALDFIAKTGCAKDGSSLCCTVSVEEGETREALSQFDGAIKAYLRSLTLPGPDSLHALALTHLGDLCARRTGEADRALGYYNLLVDLYPGSESSDRALYEMAKLYEKEGDFSKASSLYKRLSKASPLGANADEALERAEALDTFFPANVGQNELKKIGELLRSAASGKVGGDSLLEQASRLYGGQLRSFEEAQAMIEQELATAPQDSRPALLLRVSQVHELKSKRFRFEGKKNEAIAEKNAAAENLRDLVSQYPQSPVADDAQFLLIEQRLDALTSPEKEKASVSLYSQFLETYPETNRFADALLGRAEALAKLSREAGDEEYNEAIATYDKLIQEFPRNPLAGTAHFEKGRMLAGSGNIDGAQAEFETVIAGYSSNPVVPDAEYELAECKLAKRELDQATGLYASAFEKAKNRNLRERALARKGDCLLVEGKLDEAIAQYEYILKEDPKGTFADDLLAKEADAYLNRGMVDKASDKFAQLVAQFPKSPLVAKSLMRKAEAEALAGDFKKAQATYEQIETRFPGSRADTLVMLGLARASYRAGDYKSSLDAYEQVLRLDASETGHMEAARGQVLSLARIGDEGKVAKRLAWYEKNFPEDTTLASQIDFEQGMSLFEKDQTEAAYAKLSQAETRLPAEERARALVAMGMCKLKAKDFPQASKHFEDALSIGLSDSTLTFTAYFKLGTSLYAQSEYEGASRAYLAAAGARPDSSSRCEAMYNAGLCIERTENWPEAASIYEKIASTCKGKLAQDAVFKTGYSYLNAGERPKALQFLNAALENGPEEERPEVQYWIGETYAAMGEFERAASEFLKVPYQYGEGSLWAVTARYKAGLSFEETGNIEAATKQYRLLLEREGENSEWGSMAKERLLKLSK